jgi:hypothetical protein
MNTHPLNLLLDTIDDTVTEHSATSHSCTRRTPRTRISLTVPPKPIGKTHRLHRCKPRIVHFDSTGHYCCASTRQNRGYRTIRALSHSQLHIHGHCPYFSSGHRIWTLSNLRTPQRTTNRRLLLLDRVPSRDPQDSQRISRLPHSCRSLRVPQFSSIASLAYQLYYGPRSKQAHHPPMVGPTCVQQNSIPPMETVPLQRGPKDVFVNGTHRRLLLSRTRCRLERTPKESSTRCPCHPQRGSSARIHLATPNLHNAHHIWSQFYRLHQRPVQVGKRTLRTVRIDEAETTLHAAIVESLAPGTVRTINTSISSGIASLSALQLVGL